MDQLIDSLQQKLGIYPKTVPHAAVQDHDAHVQALRTHQDADDKVVIVKSQLLQDKKHVLYLILSKPDTEIDTKDLAVRLGRGRKGGIRDADPEILRSISPKGQCISLGAILTCPYNMAVLIDSKLQKDGTFYIGAVEGQGSIQLDASQLMDCLVHDGSNCKPYYVDFEAQVKVGKDNPPDLQHILDNIEPLDPSSIVSDAPTVSSTAQQSATAAGNSSLEKKPQQQKKNENNAVLASSLDIKSLTSNILDISYEHHSSEDEETRRRARADIAMKLNALRNAAYASGYAAS
eukprot:jgi/Picsp_1/5613/NSC_02972-R1_aminoacyl-trna synthetase-associated domain-containing protein